MPLTYYRKALRVRRILPRWRVAAGALVAFLHLVGVVNGFPYLSGPISLAVFCWLFIRIAAHRSYLCALTTLVFGCLAVGFCVQLLGELSGHVFDTPVWITVLLWLAVIAVQRSSRHCAIGQKCFVAVAVIWAFLSLAWVLSLGIDPRGVITFLGYGYDNAAHLTLGRMILEQGHSFLLSSDASAGPTFLQDAAQLGGTTFATLALLMGVQHSNLEGTLAIYAGLTVSIPLISVVAVSLGLFTHRRVGRTLLVLTATTALVSTGYLSRIWLSGYLNSNLGTLCLILLTVLISVRTGRQIVGLSVGTCLMIHAYPLFAGFGLALLLPQVGPYVWSTLRSRDRKIIWSQARSIVGVGVVFATLLIPLRATRRSYGGSQFLADGGIEPLPGNFFLLLGSAAFLIFILIVQRVKDRRPAVSILLVGCVCGATTTYSISKLDKIAYYPTKLLITGMLILAVFLILGIQKIEDKKARSAANCLLVLLTVGYAFFQPRETIFTGPFMGDLPHSLREARNATPVIVEGGAIYSLAIEATRAKKAILYLPKAQESELNTRWINTLSGQWTDETWTAWMQTRNALISNDFKNAIASADDSLLLIATDDVELGKNYSDVLNTDVCLLQNGTVCKYISSTQR